MEKQVPLPRGTHPGEVIIGPRHNLGLSSKTFDENIFVRFRGHLFFLQIQRVANII